MSILSWNCVHVYFISLGETVIWWRRRWNQCTGRKPLMVSTRKMLHTKAQRALTMIWDYTLSWVQSLEFIVETRILAELKIENCREIFSVEKISTSILYSMKIKMMDLWMQIGDTKLIFIMNFSVLDFSIFASRMPQIAQIKFVSTFKIWGMGRGGGACLRAPLPP